MNPSKMKAPYKEEIKFPCYDLAGEPIESGVAFVEMTDGVVYVADYEYPAATNKDHVREDICSAIRELYPRAEINF